MATVVGVVFQPGGKVYSFDPAGLELRWDERVICQTSRGREYGRVVQTSHHLPDEELTAPLKRVVRRAGPADEEQIRKNRVDAKRGMLLFREQALRHELKLKPVAAELVFDQSRIVFSFSSDERPDTRALQTDLAGRLKRRVELRQVGPREQGRLCGEVGLCGTGRLCSARYPCHDQPITLKMAKEQDLPMNPGRITGLCGRLRCCLAFEHPVYRSFRDRAPAVGRTVATPNGRGIVRSYEVLKDACVVEMDGRTMVEISLDEIVEVAAG
jgi:cell fate regulator YaaT (PSP1 superfamily)